MLPSAGRNARRVTRRDSPSIVPKRRASRQRKRYKRPGVAGRAATQSTPILEQAAVAVNLLHALGTRVQHRLAPTGAVVNHGAGAATGSAGRKGVVVYRVIQGVGG